jgi:protocatechuate 3,4-dioxygenase beta subunit
MKRSRPIDRAAGASRRDVLRAGAAMLALGTLRLPAPAGAQTEADPAADLCLLTPEQTAGPFYLPLELLREDITEGRPGIPLRLRIAVADVNSCALLPDAAVDLWHCDAQGFYSGVAAEPGSGADGDPGGASGTFLRGIQLTNADGIAELQTIYPGWYTGRTVHIHMMVHVGGTADEAAGIYDGGEVAHVGQLYFDDAVSDQIFATDPAYAGRDDARRTRNEQDGILGGHLSEPGFLLALTPLGEALEDGFLGEITVGVDPNAAR